MTLTAKIKKQKKIFDDILASVSTIPQDRTEFVSVYLFSKFEQIVKIEMDYYHIKYTGLNGINEIKFLFVIENSEKTKNQLAGFYNSTHYDAKNDAVIYNTPSIRFNIASWVFTRLFSSDYEERVATCCYLLKALFHEIRHFRQYKIERSEFDNLETYMQSKETVFADTNVNLYDINHDHLSFEADANYSSSLERNRIGIMESSDDSFKEGNLANKEVSTLYIPNDGFYERDSYIDKWVDNFIRTSENRLIFLRSHPSLLKEYNIDGSTKRLSEIIREYKKAIEEVENKLGPSNEADIIIDDIEKLYSHLFTKKVRQGNSIELLEAIQEHGVEEVEHILISLTFQNKEKKDRAISAIDRRKNAYDRYYQRNGLLMYNRGGIRDPKTKGSTVISAEDFLESLNLQIKDERIKEFIFGDYFKTLLPEQGYFLDTKGNKMEIEHFITKILVPKLGEFIKDCDKASEQSNGKFKLIENLIDLKRATAIILVDNTYPVYAFEIKRQKEFAYQKYNENEELINATLNSPIIDKNRIQTIPALYDQNTLEIYDKLFQIYNGDNSYLKKLIGKESYENGSIVYKYTEEQIELFERIKRAAISLRDDNYLNPRNIDFYSFIMQKSEMEAIEHTINPVVKYIDVSTL